jgi:hypothetical protein
VPASWSPTGYTALFVEESPEVRFDDVIQTRVSQRYAVEVPIDGRFIEVCEPGSLCVIGCVPDLPVMVGASVVDNKVVVRFADNRPERLVSLTVKVSGIRKGFAGLRFPDRTQAQFESNERFIKSAYDGA